MASLIWRTRTLASLARFAGLALIREPRCRAHQACPVLPAPLMQIRFGRPRGSAFRLLPDRPDWPLDRRPARGGGYVLKACPRPALPLDFRAFCS